MRPKGAYRDLEPWQAALLVRALEDVGCPRGTAQALAAQATVGEDRSEEPGGPDYRVLHLHGTALGVEQGQPVEEEFAGLAAELAEHLRDENAEAVDRQGRGEPVTPHWPLPGRSSRRYL